MSSHGDPAADPLLVWLNGGPGCSSFDGFVYEHGPFSFTHGTGGKGVRVRENPFSWSQAASVLYIDSPSGVGFSFSTDASDYHVNDTRTAQDLHAFLVRFLSERHPELASVPLFIGGESYAGVYVPMFAREVLRGNKMRREGDPLLNLQGYMVGNGVTDPVFDGNALVPFAAGKSLIDQALNRKLHAACGGNYWNATKGSACEQALDEMDAVLAKLNIYDSLDICYHPADPATGFRERTGVPLPRFFGRAWPLRANVKAGVIKTWPQLFEELRRPAGARRSSPPCIDDSIAHAYLNRADVKAAFHVKPQLSWELCTARITYTHDVESMLEIHRWLLLQGVNALIYSGDHDMCVPHTGTEAWTSSLGLAQVEAWRPWLFADAQVAGYVKSFQAADGAGGDGSGGKLTYATVMGAGHTVPQYKPKQSLEMLSAFLLGRPL